MSNSVNNSNRSEKYVERSEHAPRRAQNFKGARRAPEILVQ